VQFKNWKALKAWLPRCQIHGDVLIMAKQELREWQTEIDEVVDGLEEVE
jgi:hypothetical protein